MSKHFLNSSKLSAMITSLESLIQCLITFSMKDLVLISNVNFRRYSFMTFHWVLAFGYFFCASMGWIVLLDHDCYINKHFNRKEKMYMNFNNLWKNKVKLVISNFFKYPSRYLNRKVSKHNWKCLNYFARKNVLLYEKLW